MLFPTTPNPKPPDGWRPATVSKTRCKVYCPDCRTALARTEIGLVCPRNLGHRARDPQYDHPLFAETIR